MRYAWPRDCVSESSCKCIYVTAPPVSSSGFVAHRMKILLLSAFTRPQPRLQTRKHSANGPIQTAARQRNQARNVRPFCAKISPLFVVLFASGFQSFVFCLCKHASVPRRLAVQEEQSPKDEEEDGEREKSWLPRWSMVRAVNGEIWGD